jgi:hypothetical protein
MPSSLAAHAVGTLSSASRSAKCRAMVRCLAKLSFPIAISISATDVMSSFRPSGCGWQRCRPVPEKYQFSNWRREADGVCAKRRPFREERERLRYGGVLFLSTHAVS